MRLDSRSGFHFGYIFCLFQESKSRYSDEQSDHFSMLVMVTVSSSSLSSRSILSCKERTRINIRYCTVRYTQKSDRNNKKRPNIPYYICTYTFCIPYVNSDSQPIASTPHSRHRPISLSMTFSCLHPIPIDLPTIENCLQFFTASGLPFLSFNTSPKYTSSVGWESVNNTLLNDALSIPFACNCVIWTQGKKKESNPTFRSCIIQILKTAQFWREVAFYLRTGTYPEWYGTVWCNVRYVLNIIPSLGLAFSNPVSHESVLYCRIQICTWAYGTESLALFQSTKCF